MSKRHWRTEEIIGKMHLEIYSYRRGLSKREMFWAEYFRSCKRYFCLHFPYIVDFVLYGYLAQWRCDLITKLVHCSLELPDL